MSAAVISRIAEAPCLPVCDARGGGNATSTMRAHVYAGSMLFFARMVLTIPLVWLLRRVTRTSQRHLGR